MISYHFPSWRSHLFLPFSVVNDLRLSFHLFFNIWMKFQSKMRYSPHKKCEINDCRHVNKTSLTDTAIIGSLITINLHEKCHYIIIFTWIFIFEDALQQQSTSSYVLHYELDHDIISVKQYDTMRFEWNQTKLRHVKLKTFLTHFQERGIFYCFIVVILHSCCSVGGGEPNSQA